MKWWHWLILELLIIFGVMAWIYFFPCELWEEDFCRALSAYGIVFCIEKIRKCLREEKKMFNLNELCVMAYENAAKREAKDGKVSTDTMKMLKHTATEVVEAVESFVAYRDIKELAEDLSATDLDEKWESQEEPDVCEEHYQRTRKQFMSELADIVCCVLIIAGKENIDMEYALTTCMEKNYMRATGRGDK